jgi:hypothetical protein
MTTHPILGLIAPVESLGRATLEAIESSGGCSIPKVLVDINARALELPAFGQWLPIESAPKDGTRVILGCPCSDGDGGTSACGYWLDAEEDGIDYMGHDGGFTDVDYQTFSTSRSFGAPGYRYAGHQPTHWTPLPPPPTKESP